MFREYAIEPCVLHNWDRTVLFLSAFGPWKGTFLAEYPKRWKRMVVNSLKCPDVEKKKIVERLAGLDGRIFSIRRNAAYDDAKSWLENAENEHRRKSFCSIVAASTQRDCVLDANEIDDQNPLFASNSGKFVSRDPIAVANALSLLLQTSKLIVIIDPYFRADQNEKTRPLLALCNRIDPTKTSIQVHFADEPRGYEPCVRDAERALPALLPCGKKVTLRCWKEKDGGKRLHNRYILTELACVQFGDSIEAGRKGQSDHLSIMDEPSRESLWQDFLGSHPAFDSVGVAREFVGVRQE